MKQPMDHQPPKEKQVTQTASEDVTGFKDVEFYGHTYRVNADAVDDIDYLELIGKAGIGDRNAMAALPYQGLVTLLGLDSEGDDDHGNPLPSQYDRWKREQKKVHGRVGGELIQEFMIACSGN